MPSALPRRAALLVSAALCAGLAAGCAEAPLDRDVGGAFPNHNRPAGRIEGTILYDGPAPALDANGRPLGRLVLLLFKASAPPPPDGFATTALSIQTMPASQLFAGVTPLPNGNVRASAPFTFPNVAAGEFQLRAFYSNRDESQGFHPLFGVRSQPVAGDVGGGAVVDPNAAVSRFVTIPVGAGVATAQGTRYTIPAEGSVTRGVTVFVGKTFPVDRPVFRVADAPAGVANFGTEAFPARPPPGAGVVAYAQRTGFLAPSTRVLVLPSNVPAGLPDDPRMYADPRVVLGALPALTLLAGVADADLAPVRNAGVPFNNGALRFSLGPFRDAAHPTFPPITGPAGTPVSLPWTFPMVLLVKLHDPTPAERALLAQPSPDPGQLARLVGTLNQPETGSESGYPTILVGAALTDPITDLFTLNAMPQRVPGVRVAFPPVAIELRSDTERVPVVPKLPAPLAAAFGARAAGATCNDDGLPAGRYAVTVIAATGQTWSLPNDLSPSALAPNARTATPSQGLVVRVVRTPPAPGYVCPPRM